jgi:flagellar protein FlaI
MSSIKLPYEVEPMEEAHGGDPFACTLFKMLPKTMQKTTRRAVYLLEYLHGIPVNEVGIPEYITQLTRKHKEKKKKNLIYPVDGGIFIHIMDDPEGGRAYYIGIEPRLSPGLDEADLVHQVEMEVLDYAMEFEDATTPEQQKEVLLRILDRIMQTRA